MPKAEWGAKHLCTCGAKFYDMRNPTPACPKCGTAAEEAEKRKAPPDDEVKDGIESDDDLADDEDASLGKEDDEDEA